MRQRRRFPQSTLLSLTSSSRPGYVISSSNSNRSTTNEFSSTLNEGNRAKQLANSIYTPSHSGISRVGIARKNKL